MRRRAIAIGAVAMMIAGTGAAAAPAQAGVQQAHVVSANPVNYTPHALDGAVKSITSIGDTVVVGGTFTKIRQAGSKKTINRKYLFAYDQRTGKLKTNFVPHLDGPVYSVAPAPNNTVYAGGSFKHVNSAKTRGLTRLYLASGKRVGHFIGTTIGNGNVNSIAAGKNYLYVGGSFTSVKGVKRGGLARVSKYYGVVDKKFDLSISEPRKGTARVNHLAISPKNDRLVIDGNFLKVNGHRRPQAAVIYTTTSHPGLSSWSTDSFAPQCTSSFWTYTNGIDFSPGGKYFAIVTTGGPHSGSLCDSVSLWGTYDAGGSKPKWVNYTGGDSLYSVSVTGAAVYVGGHQRWMNNPKGHDSAGPGAVSRPGIAAVSPSTGKALSWNPTRTRGHGAEALHATSRGLLVGSDTTELGHEYHARLGMFPTK